MHATETRQNRRYVTFRIAVECSNGLRLTRIRTRSSSGTATSTGARRPRKASAAGTCGQADELHIVLECHRVGDALADHSVAIHGYASLLDCHYLPPWESLSLQHHPAAASPPRGARRMLTWTFAQCWVSALGDRSGPGSGLMLTYRLMILLDGDLEP